MNKKQSATEKSRLFKLGLINLMDMALSSAGVYNKYNDDDLFNATFIFMEVFMSKMYDKHKNKLTENQMKKLAEEAGKSLRQTILLFTGKDMPDVYLKR